MKTYFLFLFALLFSLIIYSQQPTHWQNHTDMKQIQSLQTLEDGVWCASGGGAFYYENNSQTFKIFTKIDGLFSTDLSAICVDLYDQVWFGSSNGAINVFNPANNTMQSVLDIYSSDRVNKKINEIRFIGDTIFVSTEFGLSLINSKSLTFYDTYSKFGTLTSFTKVISSFKHDLIYACTESGLAVQKIGATNLSAPESWNVFTISNGLPTNVTREVGLYRDTIIVSTEKGFSFFNGSSWQSFLTTFTNVGIVDFIIKGDSLIISHGSKISLYYQGNVSTLFDSPFEIRKIGISGAGLFAASSRGVVRILSGNNYQIFAPNGPHANQFPAMTVDASSNLWCSSGKDGNGKGIFRFDGNQWSVYDASSFPALYQNDFFFINSLGGNTVFAGNWGQGFVSIRNSLISRYHTGNTPMIGIPNDPNFLVITGFAEDTKNNLWILNLDAADQKSLYLLIKDSVWHAFKNPAEYHIGNSEARNLMIDQNNTKWYCVTRQGSVGLLYFNERGTYSVTSDDYYGYLTKTNGLNDNTINSIQLDQRGDLWLGTNLGVNIISNLSSVLSNAPQLKISSVFALRQQSINCIAVDALNQKWIGTNQGLLQVNSDGSRLIATYDSKNSPLLSDVIQSLAIDNNKGIVYVGTDAGLISFETPAVKPLENFAELFAYPNPLLVDGRSTLLTIDGLIKDAEIKILSVSGKLISEFPSPGGRVAYWDAKDLDGKFVSSGVYFIVAYDQDGNNVASTKIAVLRNK